jgi:hypothetical protein
LEVHRAVEVVDKLQEVDYILLVGDRLQEVDYILLGVDIDYNLLEGDKLLVVVDNYYNLPLVVDLDNLDNLDSLDQIHNLLLLEEEDNNLLVVVDSLHILDNSLFLYIICK